jgi:hypothetical protein
MEFHGIPFDAEIEITILAHRPTRSRSENEGRANGRMTRQDVRHSAKVRVVRQRTH